MYSKNIRAIGKGSWKSSAEEVKNTYDLLKDLAIFEHERTQLIDSYNHRKLREADSIEQGEKSTAKCDLKFYKNASSMGASAQNSHARIV